MVVFSHPVKMFTGLNEPTFLIFDRIRLVLELFAAMSTRIKGGIMVHPVHEEPAIATSSGTSILNLAAGMFSGKVKRRFKEIVAELIYEEGKASRLKVAVLVIVREITP